MNQNSEVICIHIGQAGVQMGHAAWELLAAEHGISNKGTCSEDTFEDSGFTTFFQETPSGQFVPRSLFVDLEPSVIDEIRVGSFGRIFHPDLMVAGMEDSGSNYARARHGRGTHIMPLMIDKIRYIAESCDALQGFIIFSSYGGGTGTGLGALFLNRLEHEFYRRPRIHIGIFPGPELSPVVVDPYNSVLFAADIIEQSDFSLLSDNSAVFNIIKSSLGIDRPTYSHLNRVSAQIVSHLTSTIRFPNTLNNSLHEMQVNLIPYPQIKFPLASLAPITSLDRARHEPSTTEFLTRSAFQKGNLMVSCDINKGLFMANSLIYRGPFDPVSVNKAIIEMKRDTKWVNWCPTGFKLGLSDQKPTYLNNSFMAASDRSLFMISNSTAIRQRMTKLLTKFHVMFAKRAFVHHYVNEGLEADELSLAFEEVSKLASLYKEIHKFDFDGDLDDDDPFDRVVSRKEELSQIQEDQPVINEIVKQSEPQLYVQPPTGDNVSNKKISGSLRESIIAQILSLKRNSSQTISNSRNV